MEKPLSGIKVLDLSTFVAAPVCSRLLADLGAEVIKVERPDGDAWRETGKAYHLERFSDEENPVFDIYNSGKQHIALDLKKPEGKAVFLKLLAQADVFVTNTRPAALKRLGISYEDLKDDFPQLIYAIVLGYGENGPDAQSPAFDTSAFWSRSGFLRDMAPLSEHYAPVLPPFGVGDTVTGYLLMGEICAALYRRKETGKGDLVRSSLYHNGIFTMGTMQIITQQPWGRSFPVTRTEHSLPGGYYRCADDEWIYVSVGYAESMIPRFCQAIGHPELMDDPRYNTPQARKENQDECYAVFRDAFAQKPSSHWLQIARELDLPMMRMNHFSEVSEDAQAWANGYLEHVTFANGQVDVMPRSPIEMESVGELKTTPAPEIGANTESILESLGYSDKAIAAMKLSGAVK
jgi:crotonobetainyl-CoA:carnitine CoA-transferase CaiB-like acyl-CoA transferase